MKPKKILFYSHDTFGLGHIRRTQKIANTLAREEYSILIACASPMARSYATQKGIEYLNLPGFTKQVTGEYVPRNLNMEIGAFVNLRASLLLSVTRTFQPDLLIIDKEPLGVKRELLPTIDYLREYQAHTKIICGFRDILDEKEAVEEEWKKRDTVRTLENYFDHIFLYGDKKIFDFAKEYSVPASIEEKIIYTGYVHPDEEIEPSPVKFSFPENRPLVTFTLGGGGDGWSCLEAFLEGLEHGLDKMKFNTCILSGPFASPQVVHRAELLAENRKDVYFSSFVSNTSSVFKQSTLVVSMGGYNTMCELAALGKHSLILPRYVPRKEQLIRAEVFKKRGYCDYINPEDLTANSLIVKILELLADPPRTTPEFPANGLAKIKSLVDAWLL